MAMQTSFLNVFKYHLSGQFFARLCSFMINLYLIRNLDISLIGFFSVRMNLLYMTVGFLSREPLRKVCLSPDLSIYDSLHYAIFSSVFFFILSVVCSIIWWFLPESDVNLEGNYFLILLSFSGSCLIEGVAEPIAILSLKLGENAHYAFAHSLLTFLQKFFLLLLTFANVSPIMAFCVAQIAASFCYCIVHLRKFFMNHLSLISKSFTGHWLSNFLFYRYEKKCVVLVFTIFVHSILKQFITDGSAYVMTFTNILPLKIQAVYDAVERLASLVTRLILTPLEESAAIYFSSNIRHNAKTLAPNDGSIGLIPRKAITTFTSLLRLIIILGLIVCVFGFPYSKIVVQIYGGDVLLQNGGATYLSFYTFYILFMAINGITECFAFASMDTPQIFSHGTFLFGAAVLHLLLNFGFSSLVGATGFIIANCVNTVLRIFYNLRHIRVVLNQGARCQLSVVSLLPSFNLILLLLLTLFLTTSSYLIFGTTGGLLHSGAHLAVGGVMFLLLCAYIYQSQDLFTNFLEKIN